VIAYIFANGPYQRGISSIISEEKKGHLIIAADGGAEHCRLLNITPHIIVGDLDSISAPLIEQYIQEGVEIIRHPARKDATDLELAIDLAMTKGTDEVLLFGVLGGRWDMSLSSVMLAASKKYNRMVVSLLNAECRVQIIHGGTSFFLKGYQGQTASLIPISEDVHGVTIKGFEYPLTNASLPFGSSRGISNILLKSRGSITLKQGTLLYVQKR